MCLFWMLRTLDGSQKLRQCVASRIGQGNHAHQFLALTECDPEERTEIQIQVQLLDQAMRAEERDAKR